MKKFIITIALATIFILNLNAQLIFDKLKHYEKSVQEEFFYIQTDRPFYETNETAWFTIWVANSNTLKPTQISKTVHFNVKDPKGNIVHKDILGLTNGNATANFKIKNIGGNYTITAYTGYSYYLDSNQKVTKEIQVQKIIRSSVLFTTDLDKNMYNAGEKVTGKFQLRNSEGTLLSNHQITTELFVNGELYAEEIYFTDYSGYYFPEFTLPEDREIYNASLQCKTQYAGVMASKFKLIPVSEKNTDLQFLPEGGWLVEGISSILAFKALDIHGKPVTVKGEILNSANTIVANFASEHDGMGKLNFTPKTGEQYYARINEPEGVTRIFELPEVQKTGAVLSIDKISSSDLLVSIISTKKEPLIIALRKANQTVYTCDLDASNFHQFTIPVDLFGIGIHQLTLFDSDFNPVCERLVFLNAHKRLNIQIETNKKEYTPREKVTMKIKIKDQEGKPVKTNFALSVVNEQMLQFSDKYRENILSKFFLQNELKGDIHMPAYYFSSVDEKCLSHLDLLMLTHGWRRIEWKDLKVNDIPLAVKAANYNPQNYVIMGSVIDVDYIKKYPKQWARAKLVMQETKQEIPMDSLGRFAVWGLEADKSYKFKVNIRGLYRLSFERNSWLATEEVKHLPYAVKFNTIPEESEIHTIVINPVQEKTLPVNQDTIRELVSLPVKVKEIKNNIENDRINVVLSEKEIKQLGTRNLNEIAGLTSGVTLTPGGGVNFRGSRTDGTAVFIDGIRIIGSNAQTQAAQGNLFGRNNYYYYANHSNYYYYPAYTPFKIKVDYSHKIQTNKHTYRFYNPDYRFDGTNYTNILNTIYYAFDVQTNESGEAELSFNNSAENGNFITSLEGLGENGVPVFHTKSFQVIKPLIINLEVPLSLTEGDSALIPFSILNNLKSTETFNINFESGHRSLSKKISLMPGEYYHEYLLVKPVQGNKTLNLKVNLNNYNFNETIRKTIIIKDKGFKNHFVLSGIGKSRIDSFVFDGNELGRQTLNVDFSVYPSIVEDILSTVDGMIRQPYGCFEQVSSVNFPNLMVLQLLDKTGQLSTYHNKDFLMQALETGYNKLSGYETKQGGFEWYGRTPPHEGLTAYGLLQFYEMRKQGIAVNHKMMVRTKEWLNDRMNSDGSIKTNQGKHGFAGASQLITTAYVTWVLSQTDNKDLSKQIQYLEKHAQKEFDAYLFALMANIYLNTDQKEKAINTLDLLKKHLSDKNMTGLKANHSITRSYGKSLDLEIIALTTIAMLEAEYENGFTESLIHKICQSKNIYGYYGTTQATVLCLKAIVNWIHLKNIKQNEGVLELYVNKVMINKLDLKNGYRNITIDKNVFKQGENQIEVKCMDAPYTSYKLTAIWSSFFPSSQNSTVKIENLKKPVSHAIGDFYQMEYKITNTSNSGIPQTVSIIPVPGGMTLIPEQLKFLTDKKLVDFYEIKDEELILYWAELGPYEEKNIPVGFKVQFPGNYFAPGASVYLYYNPEEVYYLKPLFVSIDKEVN